MRDRAGIMGGSDESWSESESASMALSTTLNIFRENLQRLSAEVGNLEDIHDSKKSMKASKSNADWWTTQFCDTGSLSQVQTQIPPTSLRPSLPSEVMDIVFSMLSKEQLKPLLYTNSFISALATQRLYHSVVLARPAVIVAFLRTLLASDRLPLLVRSLDINVTKSETVTVGSTISPFSTGNDPSDDHNSEAPLSFASTRTIVQSSKAMPTRNFYTLLARALRRMRGLVSLALEIPKTHTPLWIFDGCTFRLRQLTTSMYCRRPLARFLETQDSIVELTLRGYQTDVLMFLPFIDPGVAQGEALLPGEDVFALAPGALPNLRFFSAVHGDADLVRAVVEGRSVEVVSIPLFPERSLATLDALCTSNTPLRRLSIISFDSKAPEFIFEALSKRFVDLEALHLVLLMAEYDQELLQQSAATLSNFKSLKYITFMAAPSRPTPPVNPQTLLTNPPHFLATLAGGTNPALAGATPASAPHFNPESDADEETNGEADIAVQWHRACPTLRTIILPKGRVWFKSTPAPSAASGVGTAAAEGSGIGSGGDEGSGTGGTDGTAAGMGDRSESGNGVVGDGQTPAQHQSQVVWSAL